MGGLFLSGTAADNSSSTLTAVSPAFDASATEVDTVFDLASLTKIPATAPSVMKLIEEGRVGLYDPLIKWFPSLPVRTRTLSGVFHLLTHSSGLSDSSLSGCKTLSTVVEKAARLDVLHKPGDRFKYADINFVLLGELVERVSGVALDRYALENFFVPLEWSIQALSSC
jgi:CubicO group peptidase (beta-lactamase class C family)